MMAELRRLWRGELPFLRAFLGYGIVFGLPLNLACSALALTAYAASKSPALFLAFHLLPVPYNALCCVGASRSALKGPDATAAAAMAAAIALFLALLIV
jgi:hypothetical protein